MFPLELFIYFLVGILTIVYFKQKVFKNGSTNWPPKPWGFPFFGHFPRMLITPPHLQMQTWAKKFGPIITVDMGRFRAVVMSDVKMIRTVFNDNDAAGRPDWPMFAARSGGINEGIVFTEGQNWMEQRRFILRTLRDFGFGKKTMEGAVQEEIKELIEGFRKNVGKPVNTQNKFNAAVLNALWTLVAGERFKQDDPELQVAIRHLTTNVQEANVRAMTSNLFPFLAKYFPKLSGFEKLTRDVFPVLEFLRKPVEEHKATFQEGEPRDFIDKFLEEIHKCEDPTSSFYKAQGNKSVLFSVFDLFMAGAETTSTTLTWTILYMAKFPKIQNKPRAEIQNIVGNSRLPSLSDRPNMPYTEAVIHESMRYASLFQIGAPHKAVNDIQIGGYTIPKGTVVIANHYAVQHDESIWGDPENFRPERFLNKDETLFVKHEALIPFSVGKRVCPGETLARDELFLFITSFFQAFIVSPATSKEELSLDPIVATGLFPKPHELILTEI